MRQSLFICIGGLEFLRNIKDCVNANLSLLNTGKEIILYDKLTTSNKHKSLEERAMEFNGDMIDLNRENIKGFDVREFYVQVVAGLKKMGF